MRCPPQTQLTACRRATVRAVGGGGAARTAPSSCAARAPKGGRLSQGAAPSAGRAVMTSTAAREKQALPHQRVERGTLPEQPSAVEKDAGGEIPPGLLGVPQWTRTSSAGQEYNCMSHHSVSFTQCQRRLPFEILTSSQKGPGSNTQHAAACHGTERPLLGPATNLSGSYHCPPRDRRPLSPPSQTF